MLGLSSTDLRQLKIGVFGGDRRRVPSGKLREFIAASRHLVSRCQRSSSTARAPPAKLPDTVNWSGSVIHLPTSFYQNKPIKGRNAHAGRSSSRIIRASVILAVSKAVMASWIAAMYSKRSTARTGALHLRHKEASRP